MTDEIKEILADIRAELKEWRKAVVLSGRLQYGPVAKITLPSLMVRDPQNRMYDYRAASPWDDCHDGNYDKLETLAPGMLVEVEVPDGEHAERLFRFQRKRKGKTTFHYEFKLVWDPKESFPEGFQKPEEAQSNSCTEERRGK